MLRTFKNDAEFYASLPRKRIGACALLFYKRELLLVQPTYNPGWILPGGTVEAEESPLEGLHREIKEELDITIEPTQLLSVDYVSNRDVKGEYIQFLFAAKDLSEDQVRKIKVPPYELNEYCFAPLNKAMELLTPAVARRVASTLNAQTNSRGAIYLENGGTLYDPLSVLMAER